MSALIGIPSAADVMRLCPGIELTPSECIALRNTRILAHLVRALQCAALGYGIVGGVALYPKMGGPVIGFVCAWLIGCAMPTMPYSVAVRIENYFK